MMKRNPVSALAVTLAVLCPLASAEVTDKRIVEESEIGENWFLKGGSFNGEHYSPLTQINDNTVPDLGLEWSTDLGIKDGITGTPIVIDGVIYLAGGFSVVFAVDAQSGDVLWKYDPMVSESFAKYPGLSWGARFKRGVAVWGDSVFATTVDCQLVALDAKTGKPRWKKQNCDYADGYSMTDSPYVGGGKVFVGTAGSESEKNHRGHVTAYDASSGERLWRFYITPSADPAENDTPHLKMAAETWSGDTLATVGGGGDSWNEMTYDPVSNQLFFGTAGNHHYAHNVRSPGGGSNLFLSSIVAVNADTGEYNWHYQTVDKDSWDYNATMNIVLADLVIQGENRDTLLIAPKNGFHYALDRHTGELLTAGKFAKTTWATHINMETGLPVYDQAGEYWRAPDGESVLVWPNFWGAHSWQPMAFHPQLNLSYIPVIDVPSAMNRAQENEDIVMLTSADGAPHAPGKLVAFDPVSQSIRWSVDHALPFNGGVLATAGNLVFQGNAEGQFVAYDADTGERLWSVQTGSAFGAGASSYAIDGKQYILTPVGGGGGIQFLYPELHYTKQSRGPTRLLAFALNGDADMPQSDLEYPPLPEQPAMKASAETVATGKSLYARECRFCHGTNAIARFGGSVPDLRFADAAVHATWHAIVIGGSRSAQGMPAREGITVDESDAIRNYVLSLSEELRTSQ